MMRLTWRLQRRGLIGMSAFGALYGFIQTSVYRSAAGTTTAQQVAFGRQMEQMGQSISYLLPLPVRLDTLSGFVQWRVYGALPMIFAFWALMSATGATRGDEDRGMVETWLSAGVRPVRYMAARGLGFLVTAAIAVAVTSVSIALVAASGDTPLAAGSVVEVSLALLALTVACYGIGPVIAQLTGTRSTAAGLGGVVLLVLFFVNSFSRTVGGLQPIAALISPFFAFDRSTPLTPGGTFDAGGTFGLLVVGAALTAFASWLMQRRDLGEPLLRRLQQQPVSHQPSAQPLLRLPVLSMLYEQRRSVLAWMVGAAILATFVASVGRQMTNLVNSPGSFHAYLTLVGHGDPYAAILGFFWFGIIELLLAVYAISQVARWSADDSDGRLEMILSAPVSRPRVVAERMVTLLVSTCGIIAASAASLYVAAHAATIDLPSGDLAVAGLVLIPFTLSFAAVGAVLASRIPRATVGVLGTVALVSFLMKEVGPLMRWPDWTGKLSVFSLTGAPLAGAVEGIGLWILIGITIGGFGLGALLLEWRDVGR